MDRYWAPMGSRPITWIPPQEFPEQFFAPITYDRQVRRSGTDYVDPITQLHPRGVAWPSWDKDSVYIQWINGVAQIWGDVDGRADDFLVREVDPRSTLDLLPDWEGNFGLPDDCVAEPQTITDRHNILVNRITLQGGQSRQFFQDIASFYGMQVQVIEHSPYMGGVSEGGDTLTESGWPRWEAGAETIRFYWTIGIGKPRLTWFRGGAGQGGVDHDLEIGLTTDLQCFFERIKPGHVELAWQLKLEELSPLEGTP